MATPDGKNGNVRTLKYRTPDGMVVYVGPWKPEPTTTSSPATLSAPVAPADSSVPAPAPPPVQRYGEPLEKMAEKYLHLPPASAPPSTSSLPSHSSPLEYIPDDQQPSHLEQAVGELEKAVEILAPVRRGLSSVATIGTYTLVGLIAGTGIGIAAYHLMDNPRSLSASLFVGAVFTAAGVALGVYQARKAEQRQ